MTRPMKRAGAANVLICAIAVGLATRAALAEPRLELTHEPPPRHLRMRPRAAVATPAPAVRPATPMPAAPPPLSPVDPSDRGDELAALRDVREPVSFSLTVGYQVDGARPSGKASLTAPVQEGRDYDALRSYGFGELFFSTRGIALESLSSYFALRFDLMHQNTFQSPELPKPVPLAPPIATWFDRNTFETRTGWAEMKDFLPRRFGMRKLRIRAGSQYIYGPWVLHLDGALIAYDGDIVTASAYAGGRHADYTTDLGNERYAAAGASLRVDLRQLVSLPIAISADTLALTTSIAGQPNTAHHQLEVDWQPRRDFTLFGQVRWLSDGTQPKIATERLQLRARYHEVTNLVVDVMRRFDADWQWDPSLVANDDPTAAHLDLGPPLPQIITSLRGGTLIAENVDLLARATIASDTAQAKAITNSFSGPYVELGGALEVRLRRTVAVSTSVLYRKNTREEPTTPPILDVHLVPDPLPLITDTGETSFTEVGTRLRMSLGARQFSAMVEVYGRRTQYAETYRDPINPIDMDPNDYTSDVRGGGRVTLDAWIGKRLRLFASYDLSSAIAFAPEITSYKSLRLTMTGVY
jgi:hypothetical protein